ncbi:MAG TPA: hypothetical protein VHC00_00445 [Rhizobiaceae bacterium]|nr:hypothetical protein [Rhizobiaceae bacterium]
MMVIKLAKPVQSVSYDQIRALMAPAAHPMPAKEIEKRRRAAEKLLGRPFPKLPREEMSKRKVYPLTAGNEWAMLDAMHSGFAPHVKRLPASRQHARTTH